MARVKSAHAHGFQFAAKFTETKLPREGTKLREAYDFLLANKGKWIPRTIASYILRDLGDLYGCEIEFRGYARGERQIIFAGEHRGSTYIDHLPAECKGNVHAVRQQ